MTDNTFRTFCAATITLMFGALIWMVLQDRNEKQGIQIKTPVFEYNGEKDHNKQEIYIESPWFEYKGEK